jgi:cytochrome o ubiquinol oxidase subunit 2
LRLKLTSSSVMNVFFVPQLGSMIYTMNGMVSDLNLQADETGVFYGQSAHFSGDGFSDMHFDVHAISADAFGAWTNTARRGGGILDDRSYAKLAQQSARVPPATFGQVEPDLFQRIVTQELPPGPGPATEHGGTVGTSPAAGH